MISLMCSFHVRLFDIVTPNNLALFTEPYSSLFIKIGAKCDSFFANEILSSLHLSLFSLTLSSADHFATLSAICWALLAQPLLTTSDTVVSSTYFHIWCIPLSTARSLMRTRNNHGPNFVPWGTPDGTEPHSEYRPSESLILWKRSERKSVIELIILVGILSLHTYLQGSYGQWDQKLFGMVIEESHSNAVAPFPSVSLDQWIILISA